ncbi:MAG: NAD(P)-dependent oxidoreductase [Candidatus Thermoplasmatota archaeon]|nr:NAD(P)-dependent oxidoreductase [Candidatus Thermoplasmatota archaeon]
MKALITAPFHEEGIRILRKYMQVDYENWKETGKMYSDANEFADKINKNNYDVLILETEQVDEDVLSKCPGVKIIASCRGNPINIDREAASSRGIPIFYTPARNAQAVAEHTIAIMFAAVKHLISMDRELHAGKLKIESEDDLTKMFNRWTSFEIGGKTVGVIGLGAIGYRVAKMLDAGFGCKILVYEPYPNEARLKEVNGTLVDLNTLMKESDIVSLHVPITPETEKLVGAEQFALMKPHAVFVNTARAYCTDEDALFEAVKNKKIAAAAIDVSEVEPIDSDNRFLQFDNVVVTPHMAGQTFEIPYHQAVMIGEDIERYLNGKKPWYVKNKEALEGKDLK